MKTPYLAARMALAGVLGVAAVSRADMVTHEDMVPPLGIVGPTSTSEMDLDFEYSASLPKFDPLLGTLNSVEFRLVFDFAIIGTAISGDTVHVEVPFHSTWENNFETMLPQGGINWFFLGAQNFNVTEHVDVSSGPLNDAALLSAVTGPGTGMFAFFDVGSQLEIMGGMAQADLTEGRMSITYNYTAVPEAHQWLMLCCVAVVPFGIKFVLLCRRTRVANKQPAVRE